MQAIQYLEGTGEEQAQAVAEALLGVCYIGQGLWQKSEPYFSKAVRTYERGVEDETLSCGTGVTAVALAMHKSKVIEHNHIHINTEGGKLQVSFIEENGKYTDVNLIGAANFVFKGEITC